MDQKKNITIYLILSLVCVFTVTCLMSSCGKTTSVLPDSNIQYQVVNLSPDLLPIDLYIGILKKNTTSYYYPTPSGYFSLTTITLPFQVRASSIAVSTTNLLTLGDTLRNNVKYTLFVTGLKNAVRPADTVTYILTKDTASAITAGRGKVRFVNASPGSGGLDVTANGTFAFTNQGYKNVTKFMELPAGNYDFKVFPTGVTTTILSDYPTLTVQDGKIYTLYSYGIVGRTDSAAFNTAVIANNP